MAEPNYLYHYHLKSELGDGSVFEASGTVQRESLINHHFQCEQLRRDICKHHDKAPSASVLASLSLIGGAKFHG